MKEEVNTLADEVTDSITSGVVQSVYANDVFADIGPSEISLVFSDDFNVRGKQVSDAKIRVVLTHDVFIRMIDFLEKRAKLLRHAYINRRPNLYSGDAEELRKAFDELYPPLDEAETEEIQSKD